MQCKQNFLNGVQSQGLYKNGCQSFSTVSSQFVHVFKYLGHMITNDLSDDNDIEREIRNMFYRTNLLVCHFYNCFVRAKIVLFRA